LLFGATGFTGRKAALYLAQHAPPELRWGVVARDGAKLETAAAGLPSSVSRLTADALDSAALTALCRRTRVAISFVGPYLLYGEPLVAACTAEGTDYVDITGETLWVRGLVDRYHEAAARAGTRLVPFCGFDSVPSDLGTWMVVDWIRRTWGVGTREVFASFSTRGGLSGGTAASMLAASMAPKAGAVFDPVLLNPPAHRTEALRAANPEFTRPVWSERHQRWLTPFVMAPYNTRVVRRSSALAEDYGDPYGASFRYQEAMETRSAATAFGMAAGLWAGYTALRFPSVRRLAARFLPRSGEGPSDEQIAGGFYRGRLLATAEDGREALGVFSGTLDPGYGSTIGLACEAALTLVYTPREGLPGGAARGGLLTPASALGAPYLERLRASGTTATVAQNGAPNTK
jgi:short subunit dehydrogenase-like uncharacterized protein